jgi:hypothetical protein
MVPTVFKYWRNGWKHFFLDVNACFIGLWNHHITLYDNFEFILLGNFHNRNNIGDFTCVLVLLFFFVLA